MPSPDDPSEATPLTLLPNRIEVEGAHAIRTIERLRLTWLLKHLPPRGVWAAYVFANGFITIALLALLADITRTPFVFPSLGPTAYLFFFTPMSRAASPRNTLYGHAIGLACGYLALRLTGASFPPAHTGPSWPNLISAALSLAATGGVMVLLDAGHPPAGATTLIVSLGIISRPKHLLVIEFAVVLLTGQAILINRLAGLPYPLWAARPAAPDPHQGLAEIN
jgi:CBS domain-containing membrane protein